MKNLKIMTLILVLNLTSAFSTEIPFTVYHTNDLHSHLDGVAVRTTDGYEKRGGFARLTTLINSLRTEKSKKNEIIMGVDAGDFFAGTIYAGLALGPSKSFPELQFFLENKFDVVTLGNHEFDAHNKGLEILFGKALSNYACFCQRRLS